jgi:hypothetical protein
MRLCAAPEKEMATPAPDHDPNPDLIPRTNPQDQEQDMFLVWKVRMAG